MRMSGSGLIDKLDTSSRFTDRPRMMLSTLLLCIGGMGRELGRAVRRLLEAQYGQPLPGLTSAEFDLCDQTGRSIEEPIVPDLPGSLLRFIVEGVNCRAAAEQHPGGCECRVCQAVDLDEVRDIVDTSELGGWASAQVARFALEFSLPKVDEFCLQLAMAVESTRRREVPGWIIADPLQVIVLRSVNGAVGTAGLHVVDRLHRSLRPPFRIVDMPALLADRGRVTNRAEARAIQHAALHEVLLRSQ